MYYFLNILSYIFQIIVLLKLLLSSDSIIRVINTEMSKEFEDL